jgi:hypothetical protein
MPSAAAAAGRALALRQQVLSANDPRVQQSSQYVQELQAYCKLMAVGSGTGRSSGDSDPVQPFLQQLTNYIMESQRSQASGSGRGTSGSASSNASSSTFSHQQLAAWLSGVAMPAQTATASSATAASATSKASANKATANSSKADATEARRGAHSGATSAAAVAAPVAPLGMADVPHRPYEIDDIDESDDSELLVRASS